MPIGKAMNDDHPRFDDWIGRSSSSVDRIDERLAKSLEAILGPHLAPVGDGVAPHCIHWCLSPAIAPMAELGRDGHPEKSLDLPPVPQPRRMWAGGRIRTLDPLRIGDAVTRVSTIRRVERKVGRSGELWFVTIEHDYRTERGTAVIEDQDLVYREPPQAGAAPKPAQMPEPRPRSTAFTVDPSTVMLFRYSAITFNGHRIHYDAPYATGVEGYDGLVVHGPIQATLLYNLALASEGRVPGDFTYRGLAPAFADRPITVCRGTGSDASLYWTEGADGTIHMEARTTA